MNFIYENDYICDEFKSNPVNKLFKVIDAIFYSKINIPSFLSYNDLYGLIDIGEYYIGSISENYFCNNNHEAIPVDNYDHIKKCQLAARYILHFFHIFIHSIYFFDCTG